ncbi:ImmA/IrrE family metallo-endopeptidase [Blastococcus sp. SYSU D00813]
MASRYDPWADLERRGDIDLFLDELPDGKGHAWWLPWLRLIVLRASLAPVEQRCALAHELVHVDHDDRQVAHIGPDGPRMARRQETRADREAARRLLHVRDLAAAMLTHPRNPQAVAHELDVTLPVLQLRLETLRPSEETWLRQELAGCDHAA